jgi:hypothetical protein
MAWRRRFDKYLRRLKFLAANYCSLTAVTVSDPTSGTSPPNLNLCITKSKSGGAGESRTPDTQFRKLLLYPSELQPHINKTNDLVKKPVVFTLNVIFEKAAV